MNKDQDTLRATIANKVESKRQATDRLSSKVASLNGQVLVYENAIENARAKIETLTDRIAVYKKSGEDIASELETRTGELEHMEQILARYDDASAEIAELSKLLLAKIEADNWMPGDDPALRGALERDEEYQTALKRKRALDDVRGTALDDINRIFYSRGEVEGIHAKVVAS